MYAERMSPRTIISAACLGFAVAFGLAAGEVAPDQYGRADLIKSATFMGANGHVWSLTVWPGRFFSHDTLILNINGAGAPAAADAQSNLLDIVPHAAWRGMIREAAPSCSAPKTRIDLHAWGFPFRAMAGGFANNPPSGTTWYVNWSLAGKARTMPTRPIWFGLLANSLIYGVMTMPLLLVARRVIRRIGRWRAARRQVCPECKYDLRATPDTSPCPECGGRRT